MTLMISLDHVHPRHLGGKDDTQTSYALLTLQSGKRNTTYKQFLNHPLRTNILEQYIQHLIR